MTTDEEQRERTAIVVVEAAQYRNEAVQASVAPSASGPLAPEDIWAPQFLGFGEAAVPISRARKLYVAPDVNQLPPVREGFREMLHTIDHFGVVNAPSEDSMGTILTKRQPL